MRTFPSPFDSSFAHSRVAMMVSAKRAAAEIFGTLAPQHRGFTLQASESVHAQLHPKDRHRWRALLDVMRCEGVGVDTTERPSSDEEKIALPTSDRQSTVDPWPQLASTILGKAIPSIPDPMAYLRAVDEHAAEHASKLLLALNQVPGRLLDIGCGLGAYARACGVAGYRTTVVDQPWILAPWVHQEPKMRAIEGRWPDVAEQAGEAFELVLCLNTLHHQRPDELDAFLAAISRVLRPGGRLVVLKHPLDSERSTPAASLYFSLNLSVFTPHSRVHACKSVVEHATGAGLRSLGERGYRGLWVFEKVVT